MIVRNIQESRKYLVGGKANGLFALQQAGFNVPEFLVLPASLFSTSTTSPPITTLMLSSHHSQALLEILMSWDLSNSGVVVRSSIDDEDGKNNSFAGMMDSYLNIKTFDEVISAVKKCAQSVFSERSMAYREQRGLTHSPKPAVIIQKQISATSSGILFTTSPDYPQEVAVHAVPGFSEYLNKGEDIPDEFYLLKKDGTLNRKSITVREYIYTKNTTNGLVKEESSQTSYKAEALSESQLQQLYIVCNKIEAYFKYPCDVEFVFSNNDLFIVQSRPITQQIPEIIVYDNSNIQESYCGVTTPLTFSFASRAYATVYKQTMKALALPEKTIQNHEVVIKNLLGLVKGRIYYNINNWYRGLQLLPSFRQNKADMERMMGLTEPVDFIEDRGKSLWNKFRMLPGLLINFTNLLLAFSKLAINVDRFIMNCHLYYNKFYEVDLTSLSITDLLIEKRKLDEGILHQWTIPIVNDFYVMMSNGRVIRNLRKIGIANTDEFLSRYLSGNKQLASLLPTLKLQSLAGEARKFDGLSDLILNLKSNIHEIVRTDYPVFFEQVTAYIMKYGDRTIGELKLETETMRVNPLIFYKYVSNFITSSKVDLSGTNKIHSQALDELKGRLSDKNFFFRRRVSRNLVNLDKSISNREAMRLERTRLFGMYRSIYLAIGKHLETNGVINNQRNVFYLMEDEIIACEQHEALGYKKLVRDREQLFDSYHNEDAPGRVIVPCPPIITIEDSKDENQLLGTGCYPGIVKGEVLVITDPSQDIQAAGKIICALRTDPGWAALFPSCKGVLIEKGSSLSHSVILLRELGIPTIINVPRLTKILQTGQCIMMNAAEGKIQIRDYE